MESKVNKDDVGFGNALRALLFTDSLIEVVASHLNRILTVEESATLSGSKTVTRQIAESLEITAQFSLSADTIYLNNGGNIDFTNLSLNASSYNWDFGNFNYSSGISPSHQYTQAGIYTVTLNAYQNANCFDSQNYNIVVIDKIVETVCYKIVRN